MSTPIWSTSRQAVTGGGTSRSPRSASWTSRSRQGTPTRGSRPPNAPCSSPRGPRGSSPAPSGGEVPRFLGADQPAPNVTAVTEVNYIIRAVEVDPRGSRRNGSDDNDY